MRPGTKITLAIVGLLWVGGWWFVTRAPAPTPAAQASHANPSQTPPPPASVPTPQTTPAAPATTAAVPLWDARTERPVTDPASVGITPDPHRPAIRTAVYAAPALDSFSQLPEGATLVLPLPGLGAVTAQVRAKQTATTGSTLIAGALLPPHQGTFTMGNGQNEFGSHVLMPGRETAYVITSPVRGSVVVQEQPLSDIVCLGLPKHSHGDEDFPGGSPSNPSGNPPAPPSNRPEAAAVLYLDFDGEFVYDLSWSWAPINAAPANLSPGQIDDVVRRVREDFWPFNIDVTTDEARYDAAPVGRRMRVIITPTDSWYNTDPAKKAGGVARIGTFRRAGTSDYSNDIPCWVFNPGVNGIAETISHEAGHTFGLRHDGRNPPLEPYTKSDDGTYYLGHGAAGSPLHWGPIMGGAFDAHLTQWSKGDYPGASNTTDDDLGIIAGRELFYIDNGVFLNDTGEIADEAGDSTATAVALNLADGVSNRTGTITLDGDIDFYSFTLPVPSPVVIKAHSPVRDFPISKESNLDIRLTLLNSGGQALFTNNPADELNAQISQILPAGTYFVSIEGTGRPASQVAGDLGYPSYGSIGQYELAVAAGKPVITIQPFPVSGYVPGASVSLSVQAVGSGTLNYQWQHWIAGVDAWLDLADEAGFFSGVTTDTFLLENLTAGYHDARFRVVVSNAAGSTASSVAQLINGPVPMIVAHPAASKRIAVNTTGQISVTATSPGTLIYQWEHSPDGDLWVGVTNDGTHLGVTTPQLSITPTNGNITGWRYRAKVMTAYETVYSTPCTVTVVMPPVITTQSGGGAMHSFARGESFSVTFSTSVAGTEPMELNWVWFAGGFSALHAGGTGVPSHFSGDHTPALTITYNSSNPFWHPSSGAFYLVASNEAGEARSQPFLLHIEGYPLVTEPPHNGQVFDETRRVGETFSYTVPLFDTTPLTYEWRGPGGNSGPVVSTSATLTLGPLTSAHAGYYELTGISGEGSEVLVYGTLTVLEALPVITVQPFATTLVQGGPFSLSVVATGAGPLNYQWEVRGRTGPWIPLANGGIYSGATTATLSVSSTAPEMNGLLYRVKVSNSGGQVTSNVATLLYRGAAGRVVAWGRNIEGQTNTGGGPNDVISIGAGPRSSMAIRSDGTPVFWGYGGPVPTDLGGVKAVATGLLHTLVLKYDGTAAAWGGGWGEGDVPPDLGQVVAIDAGYYHSMALKSDGRVRVWGRDVGGVIHVPAEAQSGVVQIAAGNLAAVALKENGAVVSWGVLGGVPQPPGLNNVTAIAAGHSHCLALKGDGTVAWWGTYEGSPESFVPPPAGLENVIAISARGSLSLALKNDGTVVAWGSGPAAAGPPPGLSGVKAIAAGYYFGMALKNDGTVVTWGQETAEGDELHPPTGLRGVSAIATSGNHALVLITTDSPIIATHPTDQSVTSGAPAAFSVTLDPATILPVTYQWRRNGVAIDGATSATYHIPATLVSHSGTYDVVVTNSNGPATSNPASLTVAKATPVITWATPGAITYGTPLSITQLNATTPVPGTFTYLPSAGTVLNAGTGQALETTFTPTDAANYNPVQTSRQIDVHKADPLLNWPVPDPIPYGTPLSTTQFNITSNVPGTFSYTPALGSVHSVGTHSLIAIFTPTDSANYNSFTLNRQLTVVANTAPTISQQAVSRSITEGEVATFTVTAPGTPAPSYQWQSLARGSSTWQNLGDGGNFTGSLTATLHVSGWTVIASGIQFRCVITNSAGSVTSDAVTLTVTRPRSVPGDIDGDRTSDVVWRYAPNGSIASWTSSGGYRNLGTEDANWKAIGSGDFDGDGMTDMLWRYVPAGLVASWTSSWGYLALGTEDANWKIVGTGDFDGDGYFEALWRYVPTGLIASWTSTAGYMNLGTEDTNWKAISTGDFDGDGHSDVLWRYGPSGLIATWTTAGTYVNIGTEDTNWRFVGTGDYDGDGTTDVLWRYAPTGAIGSWTSSAGYRSMGTEGSGWTAVGN